MSEMETKAPGGMARVLVRVRPYVGCHSIGRAVVSRRWEESWVLGG